ncbi:Glyoxylase, beta-lactamase superfamily II [Yoonia tamlensis]|uniref:Glyoxylase, beta-lactamase superfamily II n=1 Tax=Yoonia tamlensis TaxID=390270 RepID=A0A1I6G9W3_9RHOB|nr:MBL fold metallo-hydrolase [Yoonia tamlensis]SFR38983.1 Glyoxylase, beta-lactamase superfamily II [Yoonia tamlensis]
MRHSENKPPVGKAEKLLPRLARVLAPNASPMTYWGTNTYILGADTVVIIDPGPDNDAHLAAIMQALEGRRVAQILVTHSHLDHSGLCARLAAQTAAPVAGFGDSQSGRSPMMQRLVAQGLGSGGEGVDHGFAPDFTLHDGAAINGDWGDITALHTPGHMANHLCFAWQDIMFTGDHIMGWSTSLISPPDGDLTAFMDSCEKLRSWPARRYFPAHGAPIADPQQRLDWLMMHRRDREAQIRSLLGQGVNTIPALTESIYHDIARELLPAAQRNVFAHLIDLCQRQVAAAIPRVGIQAKYRLIGSSEKTVTGM